MSRLSIRTVLWIVIIGAAFGLTELFLSTIDIVNGTPVWKIALFAMLLIAYPFAIRLIWKRSLRAWKNIPSRITENILAIIIAILICMLVFLSFYQ